MNYHEFVLLLARVALEVAKDDPSMKKSNKFNFKIVQIITL